MKTQPSRRVIALLLGALLGWINMAMTAEQTNQGALNLRVTPQGGGLVHLTYDLVSTNTAPMLVAVKVSTNGGATYDLPAVSFSGDVGLVNLGSNRTAVWNMSADWPSQYSTNIWFRLIASDTAGAPTGMALIPAGAFSMGNHYGENDPDELPVHNVELSAYYMDKFEVSYGLWEEVRFWGVLNGFTFANAGAGVASNHPVHTINWYDAVKWCNARSMREGLTPVYYTDGSQTNVYKTGQLDLTNGCVNWTANGYRLPTEAEWEKASRGGLVAHYFPWPSFGGTFDTHIDGSKANYWNSGDPFEGNAVKTTPIGYFNGLQTPAGTNMVNGYGLHDMGGNVWEFCWDWYDAAWYSNGGATANNTRGPAGSTTQRVMRGGAWDNDMYFTRCAKRTFADPTVPVSHEGFRTVRGL